MADRQQPDLRELIVLQRQTLTQLNDMVEAARQPRSISIQHDEKGRPIGARSVLANTEEDEDNVEDQSVRG